jgi:hypothetical protein
MQTRWNRRTFTSVQSAVMAAPTTSVLEAAAEARRRTSAVAWIAERFVPQFTSAAASAA